MAWDPPADPQQVLESGALDVGGSGGGLGEACVLGTGALLLRILLGVVGEWWFPTSHLGAARLASCVSLVLLVEE